MTFLTQQQVTAHLRQKSLIAVWIVFTMGVHVRVFADPVYTVLHSFGDGSILHDGLQPSGRLAVGSDGSLFGITSTGGMANKGIVFKFTPPNSFVILHSFGDGTVINDGTSPRGVLTQGSNGSFYGTTEGGGAAGAGTAYEITPQGDVTILHSFGVPSTPGDGKLPQGGIVEGFDGNFYGMTLDGGAYDVGTVFVITPSGTESVLHSFGNPAVPNDGRGPSSWLVQGSNGNLFGTTDAGGATGNGTFFEITPSGAITIRYSFGQDGPDGGAYPRAGVIQGCDGNFYGTTYLGGAGHSGTIYELTSSGIETVLHSFEDGSVPHDGYFVASGLLQSGDGALWGTAYYGGLATEGSVFELSQAGVETVVHAFGDGSVAKDGSNLNCGLTQSTDSTIYGVTQYGGAGNGGILFSIKPDLGSTPNFTVSTTPEVTLTPAGTASATVTVTPINGFTGRVHFSCITKPQFTDVQFGSSSVNIDGGPQQVAVNYSAASNSSLGHWTVQIVVTNDTETSIATASLSLPLPAPSIDSIHPQHTSEGSRVSISGSNLAGASLVHFAGGKTAVPIHAVQTRFTVVVPKGAQSGPITVVTLDNSADSKQPLDISASAP